MKEEVTVGMADSVESKIENALNSYMKLFPEQSSSESTRKNYRGYVGKFLTWHYNIYPAVELGDIPWDELREYNTYQGEVCGLKGNTIDQHMSAIHRFFEGVLERSWNRSAVPRTFYEQFIREVPDDHEVRLIISHAACPRDALLYSLLATSGLRLSEAVHVRYGDILDNRTTLYVGPSKNHQDRLVPLEAGFIEALIKYYRTLKNHPSKEDLIFASPQSRKDGEPITEAAVQRAMKKVVDAVNLGDKEFTPHSLRYYFGTEQYASGMSLEDLAVLMGHKRVTSTMLYARMGAVRRYRREHADMFANKVFAGLTLGGL